jgi:hypothetical protein
MRFLRKGQVVRIADLLLVGWRPEGFEWNPFEDS